ncbi:hypothetical protein VNI00_019365, partial [Paramarasmius palmivorus]
TAGPEPSLNLTPPTPPTPLTPLTPLAPPTLGAWLRNQSNSTPPSPNIDIELPSYSDYSRAVSPIILTPDDTNGPNPLQEATRSIPPWISSTYTGLPWGFVPMTLEPVQPPDVPLSETQAPVPIVSADVDEDLLLSPNMLGLKMFNDNIPGS